MFKRRIVRERVLQILYAFEMNKDGLQALIDGMLSDISDKTDKDFGVDLINRVIIHHKELDDQISKHVNNWEMGRIALIDKLLLRIGICELQYFPEIPPKVSINESIEIAKEYSTAGSGKFINGILDAVLDEIKAEGKLNKTGRGLLTETINKPKK
ncbi:MAG: transcription antitermination factor NusB [Ignavibacteriales bacterium]|nr:MAG: transcription antitermination factor NusB [Ignavibacteriales bacterium]